MPGAAYDFEVAKDGTGATDIVGQQGDNPSGAGSLVLFRFLPGDSVTPGGFDTFGQQDRILVQGGDQPAACSSWPSPPPSCDVYIIARLAVGPSDPGNPSNPAPLYLAWGYSEINLSNSCGDPAGFCNKGLYLAESLDGGQTWQNVTGTTSTDITVAPLAYDDPNYQVVSPTSDVGLFKALAVTGAFPGIRRLVFGPDGQRSPRGWRYGPASLLVHGAGHYVLFFRGKDLNQAIPFQTALA